MTAATQAFTTAGSVLAISAVAPTTNTKTAYAALTWATIGEIEDLGNVGRVYNTVTFSPISSRAVRKIKGSYNDGQQALKMAYVAGDAGRIIVDAALLDDAFYSFKLTLQDGTIIYYRAQVSSAPIELGGVDSITMSTVNLELKSGTIIIVPAP
jgi:hypothetical protein